MKVWGECENVVDHFFDEFAGPHDEGVQDVGLVGKFAEMVILRKLQRRFHVTETLHEGNDLEIVPDGGFVKAFDFVGSVSGCAAEPRIDGPGKHIFPLNKDGVVARGGEDGEQLQQARGRRRDAFQVEMDGDDALGCHA